jgi:D-inositol-3-phosphate glycosyltransferase
MNVYVRELATALAQAGVDTTVYVRRWRDDLPPIVEVEPHFRVVHIEAGPSTLPKEALEAVVDTFRNGVRSHLETDLPADAVHANYWLSGVAAHTLKHELDLPLVSTFHTLARVKAESGDVEGGPRDQAEAAVMRCSDVILASCEAEAEQLQRLYGVAPDRIEIVPPGVDHAFFSPGDRTGARLALGLDDRPVVLFVGRIQPLKGLHTAVAALATSGHEDARLVVVGGPSGPDGGTELEKSLLMADELGVADRVTLVAPQPHHRLSTYYRAADVVLVPSRSESFGLVALEAAACGTPVVASNVGGLRSLVRDGETGFLVDDHHNPFSLAACLDTVLGEPDLARSMGVAAADMARDYRWSTTAARLRRIYTDVRARQPVTC